MNASTKSVSGYDRLSGVYRLLERILFGTRLDRSRVALIGQLPTVRHALVLGDGDGRLLSQLVDAHQQCRFVTVDQSSRMLGLQRKRIGDSDLDRVKFLCCDARDYHPPEKQFDLIVMSYFVDCFTQQQLRVLLPQWLSGLTEGGWIYLADFVKPDGRWRRWQSDFYQWLMHRFFQWQTGLENTQLVDYEAVLRELPIHLVRSSQDVHPMMACRIYRARN